MLDNSFPSKYEIYGGKSLRLEVCKALEMFYSTPNPGARMRLCMWSWGSHFHLTMPCLVNRWKCGKSSACQMEAWGSNVPSTGTQSILEWRSTGSNASLEEVWCSWNLKNESKWTGTQVEEGTLQRKQFVQRRRGTLKRPGALRGHTPLRVAGAQGESQEMAGPDDEEPCLTTEECALF